MHTYRRPAFPAGWTLATASFFAIAWLLTFNAAYVSGDDVLPLAKLELRNAFVPNLKPDWTPNRMLDAYGRDLLAAGFDLVYFSLRQVVPVDFFVLFKVYAATLYAAFLSIVLRYVAGSVMTADPDARGGERWVAAGFLAVAVLGLFPWRNLTHFVAYQLAAFLCFVLLNELVRQLVAIVAERASDDARTPASDGRHPALILLAFICAFSLEAYAAMVLVCLLLPACLLTGALVRARRRPGGDALQARLMPVAVVMLVAIAFCSIAIVVTIASSQRADVPAGDEGFGFGGLEQSGVAWLTSRRGVIAVLLCAIPVGVAACVRRWVPRAAAAPGGGAAESGRDPTAWIYAAALGLVALASAMVTIVVSAKAHYDYFSHSSYPWGAFLLIAKLFAAYTVALLALRISARRFALRGAVMMLAFVATTKGALDVLAGTYAQHQASQRLHDVYRNLDGASGKSRDSGLDLASIPMQVRPLPTADSPPWFVAAFERFFRKYYGTAGAMTFK